MPLTDFPFGLYLPQDMVGEGACRSLPFSSGDMDNIEGI